MSSNWHEIKSVLDMALSSPIERREEIINALTGGRPQLREQVMRLLDDPPALPDLPDSLCDTVARAST